MKRERTYLLAHVRLRTAGPGLSGNAGWRYPGVDVHDELSL